MKTSLVIFALFVVAANAIPLKPNDMPWRIRAADEDSSKNLDKFIQAYNDGDRETVGELTDDIIKIAKEGQDHSIAFTKKFGKLLSVLTRASSNGHRLVVRALAWLIDGNRENKSYYNLETVIQWCEKRQAKLPTPDSDLAVVCENAKASQQHLQNMAGTFVEEIKEIRKHPSNMNASVKKIVEAVDENQRPFLDRYDATMDALYTFRNKQGA